MHSVTFIAKSCEVLKLPTYGYQCTQCQHEFSVFQSMKDDPIATCPECGGAVKRLLYPVGIVFKGSGWYINDSRSPDKSESGGDKPAESKSTESASTASTGSDSKTSDSKSEAAPKAEAKETTAGKS